MLNRLLIVFHISPFLWGLKEEVAIGFPYLHSRNLVSWVADLLIWVWQVKKNKERVFGLGLRQATCFKLKKRWSTLVNFISASFLKSHVEKSGRSTDGYCRLLRICDNGWLIPSPFFFPQQKTGISAKWNILQKISAFLFLEKLFKSCQQFFLFFSF